MISANVGWLEKGNNGVLHLKPWKLVFLDPVKSRVSICAKLPATFSTDMLRWISLTRYIWLLDEKKVSGPFPAGLFHAGLFHYDFSSLQLHDRYQKCIYYVIYLGRFIKLNQCAFGWSELEVEIRGRVYIQLKVAYCCELMLRTWRMLIIVTFLISRSMLTCAKFSHVNVHQNALHISYWSFTTWWLKPTT